MAKSIQDYEQDRMAPVTVTILDDDGDQKQYASSLHYSPQNIELEVGTGVRTYGYAYYLHTHVQQRRRKNICRKQVCPVTTSPEAKEKPKGVALGFNLGGRYYRYICIL